MFKNINNPSNLEVPMDPYDQKRFKEGKFDFIGVEPRVDTNR